MFTALGFALALFAQAGDPPAPEGSQATLQSCELEAEGWVCRYRVPDSFYRAAPAPSLAAAPAPAAEDASPPPTLSPPSAAETPPPVTDREAARQAKLVRRCADASWLSLCTPGDRREAKALKESAEAREALRLRVTNLAAEGDCAEAVKAALEGGDLALARDMRAFCSAAP